MRLTKVDFRSVSYNQLVSLSVRLSVHGQLVKMGVTLVLLGIF